MSADMTSAMSDLAFSTRPRTDSLLDPVSVPLELRPEDVIIAVMGVTGCGKTTFMNHFSDRELVVGHELDSCTQAVEVVPCDMGGGETIYLVDTPGFDDSERSDTEILLEIAAWLSTAHKSKLQLTGIIYLHRIIDVRIGGSGTKNLAMFRSLCGDSNLGSVVLATTMWDKDVKGEGPAREKQLKEDLELWGSMIEHGSEVMRQDNGKMSGIDILRYLINRKKKITLDIQRELVDQNRPLEDTSAGRALLTEMERLRESYEKRLADLEVKLQQARVHFNQAQEAIEIKTRELEAKLTQQREDKLKLQVTHEQIVADERKRLVEEKQRYEQMIREQEARHAQNVMQQVGEERKRMKEKYMRAFHEKACIIM